MLITMLVTAVGLNRTLLQRLLGGGHKPSRLDDKNSPVSTCPTLTGEKRMKGERKDKEKEKRERWRQRRKQITVTAGPFWRINFKLQLQACLRQRINIALQLQSGPLQEFKM